MTTPESSALPALPSLVEALRARPVRDLADPAKVGPLLEQIGAQRCAAALVGPIIQALRPHGLLALRAEPRPLGQCLPPATRAALLQIAQKPLKLPAPLAQALLLDPTLEEVLRDQLYTALREFNERVNPFFAEWGLPAILRKVMPFGSGAAIRTLEAVRGEFDRRLEPEMRRFLQGFVNRGLRRAAQVVAEGKDGAHGPALRRSLLEAVLAQPVSLLAAAPDEDVLNLAQQALTAALAQHFDSPAAAALRQAIITDLCAAAGDRTLGQLLDPLLPADAAPAALLALLLHLLPT